MANSITNSSTSGIEDRVNVDKECVVITRNGWECLVDEDGRSDVAPDAGDTPCAVELEDQVQGSSPAPDAVQEKAGHGSIAFVHGEGLSTDAQKEQEQTDCLDAVTHTTDAAATAVNPPAATPGTPCVAPSEAIADGSATRNPTTVPTGSAAAAHEWKAYESTSNDRGWRIITPGALFFSAAGSPAKPSVAAETTRKPKAMGSKTATKRKAETGPPVEPTRRSERVPKRRRLEDDYLTDDLDAVAEFVDASAPSEEDTVEKSATIILKIRLPARPREVAKLLEPVIPAAATTDGSPTVAPNVVDAPQASKPLQPASSVSFNAHAAELKGAESISHSGKENSLAAQTVSERKTLPKIMLRIPARKKPVNEGAQTVSVSA